jgi:hypothetical protein
VLQSPLLVVAAVAAFAAAAVVVVVLVVDAAVLQGYLYYALMDKNRSLFDRFTSGFGVSARGARCM